MNRANKTAQTGHTLATHVGNAGGKEKKGVGGCIHSCMHNMPQCTYIYTNHTGEYFETVRGRGQG